MKALDRFFAPQVLATNGYRLKPLPYRIKLNQNENPYSPDAALKSNIGAHLQQLDWGRYPTPHPDDLAKKLAERLALDADNLVLANGSNTLIQSICLACLRSGDQALVFDPAFSLYRQFSDLMGAEVISQSLHPETFELPLDETLAAIEKRQPKVIFICSPNNPTGNLQPAASLHAVLGAAPGLVVIDEAYHEFTRQNALDLLGTHENLVVLRTFSKAFALAGMRLGYLACHPLLAEQFRKVCVPYQVGQFARVAAMHVLQQPNYLHDAVASVLAQKERLQACLERMKSLRVYPSDSNFLLIRCDRHNDLFAHLLAAGVLVRDVSGYPGLDGCLRLSAGSATETDVVIESLGNWE